MVSIAQELPLLRRALTDGQIEFVLQKLANLALLESSKRDTHGEPRGDEAVDQFCEEIASSVSKLSQFSGGGDRELSTDLCVFISTELYWGAGGHTSLLLDLIRAESSKNKALILTDLSLKCQSQEFQKTLLDAVDGSAAVSVIQPMSLLEKTLTLRSHLQQLRPKKIILVTHQYDVVAYSAITHDLAKQIVYVHHADTFMLGMHISWYINVALDLYGANLLASMVRRGVFLWPLSSADKGMPQYSPWQNADELITCSHGTERKFCSSEGVTYAELVCIRLKSATGTHIHVGQLSSANLQEIQEVLIRQEVDPGRFLYVGAVPSLWDFLLKMPVHLCISSYPTCSPRGLVETKGCGIPILIHENDSIQTKSSSHYGYPGCLGWRTVGEYSQILQSLTPELLSKQRVLARNYFEKHHSINSLSAHMAVPDNFFLPRSYHPHEYKHT